MDYAVALAGLAVIHLLAVASPGPSTVLVIQTAAEQRSADRTEESSAFTFEAVPNPDRVVKVISELMEQEEKESYEGRTR